MEPKTIAATSLAGLIGILVIVGGVNLLTDDNLWYCQPRQMVVSCDRLSSTYLTCYEASGTSKRCTEPWQKITKEQKSQIANAEVGKSILRVSANSKEWDCVLDSNSGNEDYSRCISDDEHIAYLGELV